MILPIYPGYGAAGSKRFENIHFSGYIQPQFQGRSKKESQALAGAIFLSFRTSGLCSAGPLKIDYVLPAKNQHFSAGFVHFSI